MGMLIRRHREGVDEVRTEMAEDHPHGIATPPLLTGDTGVPPVGEDGTVPTGSVPAFPEPLPTPEEAEAEGTVEPAPEPTEYPPAIDHRFDEQEGNVGDESVTTEPNSGTPGPEDEGEPHDALDDHNEVPKRNASKAAWLAYLVLDSDDRSRDELAESVLGPVE